MEPLELRGFALTLHLLGIVLGGGGALTSAAFFLSSLQKHGTLPARDAAFFRVSALVIWTGIALAIGSGLVLLSLHPGSLLGSPVFQAKLTLVTVVVANGLVITRRHQALLERGTDLGGVSESEDEERGAGRQRGGP